MSNNIPNKAEALEALGTLLRWSDGFRSDAAQVLRSFISGAPDAANAGEPVAEVRYDSSGNVRWREGLLRCDLPEGTKLFATPTGAAPDHFADASKMIPAADGSTRAPTDAAQLTDAQILAGLTAARQRACDFDYDDGTTAAQREAAQTAAFREGAGLTSAPAEPLGWLYDWTHSSALGKPDERFTSFTTDETYARKHDNPRPVWGSPDAPNAGQPVVSDVRELANLAHAQAEHYRATGEALPGFTPAADESTRAPEAELPEPEAWRGVDLVDVGVGTARDVVLRWEKLDERDEPLFTAEQMRAYRASGERTSAPAPTHTLIAEQSPTGLRWVDARGNSIAAGGAPAPEGENHG